MKFPVKKKLLIAALIPAFGLPLSAGSYAQSAQQGQQEQQGQQSGQAARTQQGQQQQQNIRDMRASEVIGATVRDRQGQKLGEVQDLIVDVGSERVNYAILAFGGFLGFGEKLFAYPMERFQARGSGGDKELVLSVNEQELKNAPGFDRSNWPTWGTGGYRGEVDKHFGKTAAAGGNLVRMSELLGEQISDRVGNDVGQVEDVVVSVTDGKVRFVALKPANDLNMENRIVMLPMAAIEATSEQQFQSQQSGASGASEQSGTSGASQQQDATGGTSQQPGATSGASQQQDATSGGMTGGQGAAQQRQQQRQAQQEQDRELKLVLNVAPKQLRNARSFQEGQWPDLNSRSFQRDTDRYVASFPTGGMASGDSGTSGESDSGTSAAPEGTPQEQPGTEATSGQSDVQQEQQGAGATSGQSDAGQPGSTSGASGTQGSQQSGSEAPSR